jgi:hypothetical protein
MALKGATYMQSALEGSWLMPNNLLKSRKLFSRPCLNSLPCGEGLGVGVAVVVLRMFLEHAIDVQQHVVIAIA